MIIETQPFKTSSGIYISAVFKQWLSRYWWAVVLPELLCVILAFTHNIAFAFVALMLLFIIYPIILSFIYFYYALTPRAVSSLFNRKITITQQGLHISYIQPEENNDKNYKIPADETILWNEIKSANYSGRYCTLHLRNSSYCYIIIPFNSITENANRRTFTEFLYNRFPIQ